MTKSLLLLLQASLLAAFLQPIICPSREMFITRQDRASHIDTNYFNSFDNPNNFMGNPIIENQSRNLQRRIPQSLQIQHYDEPSKELTDKKINDIFEIGPGTGVVLFHNPPRSHHSINDAIFKTSTAATTTSTARSPQHHGDFVFADQLYAYNPSCKDGNGQEKTFCNKVQNYPKLSDLSAALPRFETFFGEDELSPQMNFSIRFNNGEPEPGEQYLCDSEPSIIYPEAAMTKDNNWLLVVNNYGQYKQGVKIETCKNDGEMCRQMDSLQNGYKAYCKQTYIYRKLVAITPNGTLTKDNFKMPACCKCVLQRF